jgi:hypothetical protein
MRIITGDECGLLKETIPELSRLNSDGKQSLHHTGDVGVTRLDDMLPGGELNMARTRGVVDLAFCEVDSTNHEDYPEGRISFCALRTNGSVENWEGFCPNKSKEDRICGGLYKCSQKIDNVFESQNKDETPGYVGRPVAMCSAHPYHKISCGASRNVITCCSSSGIVSVIDANEIKKGIVSQYDAYSKDNAEPSKIKYTKGEFVNRDIATAMAMSIDAQKIVVGGRERAATMIDIETGKKIWKVRFD